MKGKIMTCNRILFSKTNYYWFNFVIRQLLFLYAYHRIKFKFSWNLSMAERNLGSNSSLCPYEKLYVNVFCLCLVPFDEYYDVYIILFLCVCVSLAFPRTDHLKIWMYLFFCLSFQFKVFPFTQKSFVCVYQQES